MLKSVNSVFDSLTERQTSLVVHINWAHPVLVERMDQAGSRGSRRTFDGNCEALNWLLQPANMNFRLLYLCIDFSVDNHLWVCGLSVWLCAISASRNTCVVSYQRCGICSAATGLWRKVRMMQGADQSCCPTIRLYSWCGVQGDVELQFSSTETFERTLHIPRKSCISCNVQIGQAQHPASNKDTEIFQMQNLRHF